MFNIIHDILFSYDRKRTDEETSTLSLSLPHINPPFVHPPHKFRSNLIVFVVCLKVPPPSSVIIMYNLLCSFFLLLQVTYIIVPSPIQNTPPSI